ncbi:MAG: response regulator [Anaerolineales bacterium]
MTSEPTESKSKTEANPAPLPFVAGWHLGRFSWNGEPLAAAGSIPASLEAPQESSLAEIAGGDSDWLALRQRAADHLGSWVKFEASRPQGYQAWLCAASAREEPEIWLLLLPADALPASEKHLIEALPLGLALFDSEGRLRAINPALEKLLDFGAKELIGQDQTAFWQDVGQRAAAPEFIGAAIQHADAQRSYDFELEMAGLSRRHLQVNFFQLGGQGWGALFQDISQARDQAEWKLELLSNLAHDLHTPLATLKGHTTALLANYTGWNPSMILEFLETMDQSVDDLVRQVDRSLALTRLEAGRLGLQSETTAVEDLVRSAMERAVSSLGELNTQLSLPGDLPEVQVDPARIEEVLIQLLENAARFNPSGAPIHLRASASEAVVELSVVDHGPGVPPERQQEIFQRGFIEGSAGQTGLGLYISQKIIEAHGGRIWVESPPPQQSSGAAFRFTLPILPDEAQLRQAAPASSPEPSAERTVLVVEPDLDLQALLRAILEPAGYRVELASAGPTALDRLASVEPSAVILDLSLPRMDGLAVCGTIRRRSNLPILVLISQDQPQDLEAAVDAGADDYLTKPFQSTDLLARLRALLRRADRWRQPAGTSPMEFGNLVIHPERRSASLEGEPLDLTPTEYELLQYLAHHQGQVLTHAQLIEALWPLGQGNRQALFVHINRLRAKIEPDPEAPVYIVTRWGVGYTFRPRKPAPS